MLSGEIAPISNHYYYYYVSLLVACQSDVSRKLNHTFLLVDSFNFNFVDDEHSDISCRHRGSAILTDILLLLMYNHFIVKKCYWFLIIIHYSMCFNVFIFKTIIDRYIHFYIHWCICHYLF